MQDKVQRIVFLLLKQQNDALDESEDKELAAWLQESEMNRNWYEKQAMNKPYLQSQLRSFKEGAALRESAWTKLSRRAPVGGKIIMVNRLKWVSAAASVIIIAGLAILTIRRQYGDVARLEKTSAIQVVTTDVLPGASKAVLTLADGRKIDLDSSNNKKIGRQGSSEVVQVDAGRLAYKQYNLVSGTPTNDYATYNTLETPAAAQYQVTLPDGTRVWLNNASSLKYPTVFSGKQRQVELSGEAYFEVARDKNKPFHVKIRETDIEVVGTHFNVMGYSDEIFTKTTLLEGAVIVQQSNEKLSLRPGEQSVAGKGRLELRTLPDPDKEIAWKNGFFHFEKADLHELMRPLARWYNLQVKYEGVLPDIHFRGDIQRDLTLAQVFKILANDRIHFEINNNTVTVKP